MKVSLLHPSRNRAAAAEATISEWLGKRSGLHTIEYVLSIDKSDSQVLEYRRLAERHKARLVIYPNRNYVQACNRAAPATTGDLIVIVSDDFGCPEGWDAGLAEAIGDRRDVAVLVDDGLGAKTMTLPIVDRTFYQSVGYLFFPGYIHLFSDNDLEEVARRRGRLIEAKHLLFPHRHYSVGGSAFDETYRKSDQSWGRGAHMFQKRQVRGFDLEPRALGDVVACSWLDVQFYVRGGQAALKRAMRRVRNRFIAEPK